MVKSAEKRRVKRKVRGRPRGGVVADTDLARALAAWIAREDLSYETAGDRLGVNGSTVQRWVSGDSAPTRAMLAIIREELGEC